MPTFDVDGANAPLVASLLMFRGGQGTLLSTLPCSLSSALGAITVFVGATCALATMKLTR